MQAYAIAANCYELVEHENGTLYLKSEVDIAFHSADETVRALNARIADVRKAFETSSRNEENRLRARVAELEQQLAFANDAAAKGEAARLAAAGMEARIAELEQQNERFEQALRRIKPWDVLRETIYASDWLLSNLRGRTRPDEDARHEITIEFPRSALTTGAK